MVLSFLKSTSTPITIDFGYSDLKVMQIVPGQPASLVAAACAQVPESAQNDAAARAQFLNDALPRVLREGGFKGRHAICSIPAWQTFVQHMRVRKNEGEIADQLKTQLQTVISCDPNNVVVRHIEVRDIFANNEQSTEVICFAVARDVVMRLIDMVRKCRLDVVGFHAEPIAIAKAYEHLYRREGDDKITTMYLDIGQATSKVMIAHGKEIKFTRSIAIGGKQFTQVIGEALHCDAASAAAHREAQLAEEGQHHNLRGAGVRAGGAVGAGAILSQAKRLCANGGADAAHGGRESGSVAGATIAVTQEVERRGRQLPREFSHIHTTDANDEADDRAADPSAGESGRGPVQGAGGFAGSDSLVRTAMAEQVQMFVDELRMCMRYHRQLFSGRPLDRLVIMGGEARDRALCTELARGLNVAAYNGDPFKRLKGVEQARLVGFRDDMLTTGWAVPIGLASCPMEM